MSAARRYRYLVQSHRPILVGGSGGGCGGGCGRLLRVLVEAQLLCKVPGQPFYSYRIFGSLPANGLKHILDFKINKQKNKQTASRYNNIIQVRHGSAVSARRLDRTILLMNYYITDWK